jgi:hypothetical protein
MTYSTNLYSFRYKDKEKRKVLFVLCGSLLCILIIAAVFALPIALTILLSTTTTTTTASTSETVSSTIITTGKMNILGEYRFILYWNSFIKYNDYNNGNTDIYCEIEYICNDYFHVDRYNYNDLPKYDMHIFIYS